MAAKINETVRYAAIFTRFNRGSLPLVDTRPMDKMIAIKTAEDIPASAMPPSPLNLAVQNPDTAPENRRVISEDIPIIPIGFLNTDTKREQIKAKAKKEIAENKIPNISAPFLPLPFFRRL